MLRHNHWLDWIIFLGRRREGEAGRRNPPLPHFLWTSWSHPSHFASTHTPLHRRFPFYLRTDHPTPGLRSAACHHPLPQPACPRSATPAIPLPATCLAFTGSPSPGGASRTAKTTRVAPAPLPRALRSTALDACANVRLCRCLRRFPPHRRSRHFCREPLARLPLQPPPALAVACVTQAVLVAWHGTLCGQADHRGGFVHRCAYRPSYAVAPLRSKAHLSASVIHYAS